VGRAIHRRQKIVNAPAAIDARTALTGPAPPIAVAVVAIALVQGGHEGVILGLSAVAIWLAAVVAVLFGSPLPGYPRTFLLATGSMAALAAMAAFSLGWSPDPGAGFTDVVRLAAYLGVLVLVGVLLRPGHGRPALAGVTAGLVAVSVVAAASRLLGVGAGDAELVSSFPSAAGRLSFPTGYWNALGAMTAMAVPLLVWCSSASPRRWRTGMVLVAFVPVLLTAYMTSSRGALIAAALGAAIAVASSPDRGRSFAALVIGAAAAAPAVIAAAFAPDITSAPWAGFGRSEAAVIAAAVIGAAFALGAGPAFVARFSGFRIGGLRMRHLFGAASVALLVVIFLAGPGRLAGDFAATSGREAPGTGGATLSVTGSGRAQFWAAALDAFEVASTKGIGIGGYQTWWNRKGTLETPAENAHSEPLELLAELGPAGAMAFAALFAAPLVASISRARHRDGAAGAGIGLLTTAMVGFLIDWTWDVPAVVLPVMVVIAVLTGGSLRRPSEVAEKPGVSRAPIPVPALAVALVAIALAVPSIWAGGVLAVATGRIDASEDARVAGHLDEAAGAARSAAAVQPWAAAPWVQLATVEQTAGNADAGGRAVRMAIERSPDDFRNWLLASSLAAQAGNDEAAASYAGRAILLAPLVLPRAAIDPSTGFRLP